LLELERGRFDEAESTMRRVIDARRRVFGERHVETLTAQSNLGFILSRSGEPAAAEAAWSSAWDGLRVSLGDDHPTTVKVACALIGTLHAQGWPARAHETLASVFETAPRLVHHAELPAMDSNNFAWYLLNAEPARLRDPETALALASRACELERSGGGSQLWMFLDTLAAAQHATGSSDAASATQREALRLLPETHAGERAGMEQRQREYEHAAGG
jgi:hypothetical protein